MDGIEESVASPMVADSQNPTQSAQKPSVSKRKKQTEKKDSVWTFFEKLVWGVDEPYVESTIASLKDSLFQLYECYMANVVQEGPTSTVQPSVSSMAVSTCDLIMFPDDCDDYADEVIKKAKTSTSTSSSTSTVASEAAFSAGGRVVSEKRASLSPNTIQALISLKDWKLADARKQDMEQEEHREEDILTARLARPNWMTALEGMESGATETNIETTSN
ncbi:hypothetical protein M0R45_010381 [Rubus argutus]|uniref:HAT C-terminal dimerisation domain-containing protein n=1 Tax=Rubus argutus TaxID=59490 RepID=A0AAW1Y7J6_RUBAR